MKKKINEVKSEVEEEKSELIEENIFYVSIKYIHRIIKIFLSISGVYFVWILLHYFASHFYVKLCVPNTIFGFIISPFMVSTPQCQGLRWLIYNSANIINNMWTILGAWICSTILVINQYNSFDKK
jgi:hypothetical protein